MSAESSARLPFRADIEGLRGVAVLLVVLAHADVPGWHAGFVGVDIFFVISGFLITGLLCNELETTGRIDYWAFYARRARRLVPALVTMLVVVSLAAVAFLPGSALQAQLDAAFWAALWVSNLYFAFGSFDYFGASAQENLFLHTWSLGVEEQFYLVWPLLAVLAWRLRRIGWGWLPLAMLGSFLLSLVLMEKHATSAYFLMPTRLWQLALGAWIFRWTMRTVLRPAVAAWLGWAGVALMIAALLLIGPGTAYPGAWALLPAVSAAMLLAASAQGPVSRALSSRLLRFPGRISYSWYLWHWPVLSFLPALGLGSPDPAWVLALVLLSMGLGWAGFLLVEQPVRLASLRPARGDVILAVLALIVLAALLNLAGAFSDAGRSDSRLAGIERHVLGMISIPSVYDDKRCDQWYHSDELVPCALAAGDGSGGRMLVIVDSVGAQWLPAMELFAARRKMSLEVLTKSSCPIIDQPFVYERIHRRFAECERWRDRAVDYVAATRPTVLMIGSTAGYPFTPSQWHEGTSLMLTRLVAAGARPVVLAPTPLLEFHGPRCILAGGILKDGRLEIDGCESPLSRIEPGEVLSAMRTSVRAVPGSSLVYLNDLVCVDGRCRALAGQQLVYRDEQHLNADFVRSLAPAFDARITEAVESARRHAPAEDSR